MGCIKGSKCPKQSNTLKSLGIRPPLRNGIRHTKQSIKLMKERAKSRANYKGEITSTKLYWQLNKSFEYRQWRSDVFTRDNFTCVKCGKKGIKLNAHHKKTIVDILKEHSIKTIEQAILCSELWNINNGETVCLECHYEEHRKMRRVKQ